MAMRIGELLLQTQRITPEQLQQAQQFRHAQGGTLAAALVKLGSITDDELTRLLSEKYGVPAVSLAQLEIEASVARLIPAETARRYLVVPLARRGATLTLAVADPTNDVVLDDIKFMTGYLVEAMLASEASIRQTIERVYGQVRPSAAPSVNLMSAKPSPRIGAALGTVPQMASALQLAREERVEFSAYFPTTLRQDTWSTMLVYAHVPSARNEVQEDSDKVFYGLPTRPGSSLVPSSLGISRGAEIEVVPSMAGCEFNPPRASILWLEDWHRLSFRVCAHAAADKYRTGSVRLYVGPVLVGELPLWADIGRPDAEPTGDISVNRRRPYQAIFVSYSHQDDKVIAALERAYQVLGLKYLRDIRELRSGQQWNDALLEKIGEADVFQLCWSNAAAASVHVEREWRHALGLQRSDFIRPVFWETPMPPPPAELEPIHFARLEWI
jgi:hypothetical protein